MTISSGSSSRPSRQPCSTSTWPCVPLLREAEFAHHLRLFLVRNAHDELPFDARQRMEGFLTELEETR